MPPRSTQNRHRKPPNYKRNVVRVPPDMPARIIDRHTKRMRLNFCIEDVSGPTAPTSAVNATAAAASFAVDDLDIAPHATVDDQCPDYDDCDFIFEHGDDDGGSPDAGLSLDKKAVDDASKMPEPAMDQAPSFGGGCDQPTATRSVTCYYVTGKGDHSQ
ncbi:hypothetical protein [Absidia glauca]|uniref:Uncharacterized protein n=1 Tax=Absidia glauca TaxID=4829 RepID=A0A163J6F8_ABSGL|nr:hypothetical protein [Absidia glauca]